MQTIGEAGYILSKLELVFLASLTGAEEIYGLSEQFFLNEQELEQAWEKAKNQLVLKKYIEVALDNTVTVDKDLFAIIDACCHPDVFIGYWGREHERNFHLRNCYITDIVIVELDEDRLRKNNYILTPMTNMRKAASNLRECFEVKGSYRQEEIRFTMPLSDFKKINWMAENEEKKQVLALLNTWGCEAGAAEDLFTAIKEKRCNKSLVFTQIHNGDKRKIASYTVIEGKEYYWKLEMNAAGQFSEIACKTCTPEMVADAVEKLVLKSKD